MKEKRIVSLDALRGIAAFAVAIPHFAMAERVWVSIAEGVATMAVEVFFILSGFVLAPQILYCLKDNSIQRFGIFLARRWMRTIPLYILALVVTAAILHQLNRHDFYEYLFFIRNFYAYKPNGDFFPVAWSLAIEEWFYIVFPFFLVTTKYLGIKWRYSLITYFGIFFIIRVLSAIFIPDWPIGSHREVMVRLDSIGFGFLLYCAINIPLGSRVEKVVSGIRKRLFIILLSLFLMTTIFLALYVNISSRIYPLFYFYIAAGFSMSILLYFHDQENHFKSSERISAISAFGGAISYSVYLFHYAALIIIEHLLAAQGIAIRFSAFLIVVILISYFLRLNFEKPILRVRPNYDDLMTGSTTASR